MFSIYNHSNDKAADSSVGRDERLHLQYKAVQKLASVISAYADLPETLYEALKVIAETLEVENVLLLKHDPQQNVLVTLRPIYTMAHEPTSLMQADLEEMRISLDESSTSTQTFLDGRSIYVNNPVENPITNKERVSTLEVRNLLTAPVRVHGQVQGVCCLHNKLNGAEFTPQDVEDLEALALILANLFKTVSLVKSVENEHRRHLAVLDAAVDGFIEVGRDMKVILFSKGAETLTGWKAEEAVGHACHEILMPHSPENEPLCTTCPLRRSFQYNVSVSNVETLIRNRDGEDNWVSCSYNSVTDERGQVVSGVIAIKDIYRIKALSDELRQQSQQQESLLAVNNAINGLSNIQEIYRVSLSEISNAINFDLGAIHAIDPNTQELILMSLLEKDPEPVKAVSSVDEEETDTIVLIGGALGLQLAHSSQGLGGLGLSLEEEQFHKFSRLRLRRASLNPTQLHLPNGEQEYSLQTHSAQECEALRQNEPYMSVNLPGKPVCDVLHEFEGLQSHLCVPIKTNERTYGVLHLASRKPYAFWGSDFVLTLSICKQVAVAAERARLFEQIDRLARTDALTGLYNKREFWERIDREIRRAERRQSPLSMAMIDLDRLKWINDCFGHSHGDMLLARLGELIRILCRASDIAFRYGGDELCILFPDTSVEEAKVAADRLRSAARKIKLRAESDQIVIGEEIEVTMSIGVASYPGDATGATELFERADVAMYRAKEIGKDRSVIFDSLIDLNKASYRRRESNRDSQDERLRPPRRYP